MIHSVEPSGEAMYPSSVMATLYLSSGMMIEQIDKIEYVLEGAGREALRSKE
jgi:hypothetical protein